MLENFVPPYNATVVEKLAAADAVIPGKLNMDEFAMGSTSETSYYRKTKNAWDQTKVPGVHLVDRPLLLQLVKLPFALELTQVVQSVNQRL